MTVVMDKKRAANIFKHLSDYYGDVSGGLDFTSLYELTVSVVLSAQTTDRQVNLVTPELFKRYKDFAELARADVNDVEKIIKSVGFYHTKAKNIIGLSAAITERFGGNVPDTMEELVSLPGVGRKSANVILSMGYDKPAFAVDTHVTRLANRLGFINSNDPLKVELAVTALISPEIWKTAHVLLINHGRKICMARNPACIVCPVAKYCDFVKGKVEG